MVGVLQGAAVDDGTVQPVTVLVQLPSRSGQKTIARSETMTLNDWCVWGCR